MMPKCARHKCTSANAISSPNNGKLRLPHLKIYLAKNPKAVCFNNMILLSAVAIIN